MEGVLDETVAAVTEVEGLCGKLKSELLTQFDETHKRLVEELKENQADREGILLEEIALLRVENKQMQDTVETLTAKSKELMKFKSKLEMERKNHEHTSKQKRELEEALAIAKGYRKNAIALEKEQKELHLLLDALKRKLQAYESKVLPSPGQEGGSNDTPGGVAELDGMQRLVEENKELREVCRSREMECLKLKGQLKAQLDQPGGQSHPTRSGVGSNLQHQGRMSPEEQKTVEVGAGGPSPAGKPSCSLRQMEKENRGSNEREEGQHSSLRWPSDRVEFNRGTLSTDVGSSKKRRLAEERERIIEWGAQMGSRRANDCSTPPKGNNVHTPRRHQSAARQQVRSPNFGGTPRTTPRRGGIEFDPTLPCTFAESLDLTQLSEPASPGPSEGAASAQNVEMGEANAAPLFSPVQLSQNQASLEHRGQEEMADPPQICEAKLGVLGGRRVAGSSDGNQTEVQEATRWNRRAEDDIDEMDAELCVGGFEGVIDMTSQGGVLPKGEQATLPEPLPEPGNQPRPAEGFKYDEVVRKKADREKLPGFECVDCRKFYQALSTWGNVGQAPACGHAVHAKFGVRGERGVGADAAASLCNEASRHRHRHGIPLTPQGFWDLDFPNSADPKN